MESCSKNSKADDEMKTKRKNQRNIEIYGIGGTNDHIYVCHDCKSVWTKKGDIGDYTKCEHEYGYYLLKYALIYKGKLYNDEAIEAKRKEALKSPCCVGGVIELLEAKNEEKNIDKKLFRCSICHKAWEEEKDIGDHYKAKEYIEIFRKYNVIAGCRVDLIDLYVKNHSK